MSALFWGFVAVYGAVLAFSWLLWYRCRLAGLESRFSVDLSPEEEFWVLLFYSAVWTATILTATG